MRLSRRLSAVKPSATMAVTEKAIALRAQGLDVIGFGAGEPDFDTPEHIKEAAVRALREGRTKYTPVGGTVELKEAIVAKLARDNGLEYGTSEVIASCGGKHALYVAFQVLFEEGDEVLVPGPFWVSYPDMLALAGARARILRTRVEDGFRLPAETIEAAITPATRALILNAPSNPAGVTYDEKELEQIAEVVLRHGLLLICDDVYEMIRYEDRRPRHIVRLCPELRERTLIVNSVSKTYAMTGWRVGYTAGPAPVIRAMATLQGQMTSNPTSIAQAAAAEALRGPQESVAAMVAEFGKRRNFVLERLAAIPGVRCPTPGGAFYVFPHVGEYLRRRDDVRTAEDLSRYLIETARVALVGGTDFGYPDHVRISYATSVEALDRGLSRIAEALAAL